VQDRGEEIRATQNENARRAAVRSVDWLDVIRATCLGSFDHVDDPAVVNPDDIASPTAVPTEAILSVHSNRNIPAWRYGSAMVVWNRARIPVEYLANLDFGSIGVFKRRVQILCNDCLLICGGFAAIRVGHAHQCNCCRQC
jgi:hypothetical protein